MRIGSASYMLQIHKELPIYLFCLSNHIEDSNDLIEYFKTGGDGSMWTHPKKSAG